MKKIKYTVTDTSINGRLEALEKKYDQHIKAEHIGYDPTQVTGSSGEYQGVHPSACECPLCKPLPSHNIREKIARIIRDKVLSEIPDGFMLDQYELADKIMEVIHEK